MSQHTDFAKSHMDKCIEALKANFARVRSGRANPHILDPIKVDYYGQPTPITQLAGVKVPSPGTRPPSRPSRRPLRPLTSASLRPTTA